MTSEAEARLARHAEMQRGGTAGGADGFAKNGVTAAWLAKTFDMSEHVVRQRLRRCPTMRVRRTSGMPEQLFYDIAVAAAYLVTPAFSVDEYMRALKKGQLPPTLQQSVWDAMLKRQKWEENAGDLWRTQKVREVLGSTFQTMKFSIQLWAETVAEEVALSTEQREVITRLCDALQDEIYQSLVGMSDRARTEPQLGELAEEMGENMTSREIVAQVDSETEDDIDIMRLV